MSLPVPLAVRVGDTHVTREVSGVRFRREAIGGVRNITLRLARPLDRVDQIPHLSRVYLYDARSAETIAEGRIADLGRGAGASGQQWDIVAFGPAQHASNKTFPYIAVDQHLDGFTRYWDSTRNASTQADERDEDTPSLLVAAEEGKTVASGWRAGWAYRGIRRTGQKLARVSVSIDAGLNGADYERRLLTAVGDAAVTIVDSAVAVTTTDTLSGVVVTDFTNGDDTCILLARRINTSTTGAETHWFEFWSFAARALLHNSSGTELTSGYTGDYVVAHQVVNDLLGAYLDEYDGSNASVDTGGTYQIDHLAYPDGASPATILDDLMLMEPAYRWTTGPSNADGKHSFAWEPWPTTVRYEATLDDGAALPSSAQELFNEVMVRYRARNGQTRTVLRTGACPILDDAGVTRRAQIDLADEVGSTAAAIRAGDNFLADHQQPNNAGGLTISRPVLDLETGRMVEPFEIQAGELIRVLGLESYADALNASSSDGQTVFRIWSMEYDSDSNSAELELDTYRRTTANAVARLIKRRNRKR